MKKPRMKRPEDWKEYAGLAFKSLLCPAIAAYATWTMLAPTEWRIEIKILLGLLSWWFWFWPVSTWLLSPIWNSLYVPRPDFPADEGFVDCKAFSLPNRKIILIRGITGEMIEWNESCSSNPLDRVCRIKDNEEDSLELLGEVQLRYSFEEYEVKRLHMSRWRNTLSIEYKWPRYTYHVFDGTDISVLQRTS